MNEPIAVCSPLPALIVSLLVADGDFVDIGAALCITETMKCEHTCFAPGAGRVRVVVRPGDVVAANDLLIELIPVGVESAVRGPTLPAPRSKPHSPQEIIDMLCDPMVDPTLAAWAGGGRFVEHDLVDTGHGDVLVAVHREPGEHSEALVVGVMTHVVDGHPDGIDRVWIAGDPSRAMGAVGEGECRQLIAAFDLAERLGVPVEWIAVSSGARIAWDSGTENMDWCAAVVARIVTFTQGGGSVIIVVAGVNVGAQSYFNAEATMLTHHRGVLIMLRDASMVLTGRRALELSGGGAFASEVEIGGFDDVMGPNGEAHHVVESLPEAYRLIFDHLSLCEARRDGTAPSVATADDLRRSVCESPYAGAEPFATIGDLLDRDSHPTRKRPFAIRPVMQSLIDADAPVLERWAHTADAAGAVVWDTRMGGAPVCVIGIESRPIRSDTDPTRWMAGSTLYPQGSRKIARAINAASGRRPLVVMANLAGFDGSPASLKSRQLEHGAEIGRAVVNFDGPIVVVVLGRFHGGAYVVLSRRLNPNLSIVALEGSFVSVIGGDAAAGVVFAGEVRRSVETQLVGDPSLDREDLLRSERELVARRFDQVHSVERAASVGSVDQVISARDLRPTVIELARKPVRPVVRAAAGMPSSDV